MGSVTFNYTGGWQHLDIPTGVSSVTVDLRAAGSGSRHGGKLTGRLAVKDTDVLYVLVPSAGHGNSGHSGGAGGFGGGGDGGNGYNANGGDGGGGYAAIRLNSTAGKILCAAGGAGGDSGDGGHGGVGGGTTGGAPTRGTAGSNASGLATGGTQTQGGNGGTSSSGSQFNGHSASDTALTSAGDGGTTGGYNGPGGGGGGGGWHPGGGGAGGSTGYAPAGGGAGGSTYTGALTSAIGDQAGGNTGNGTVTIAWSDPAPANRRPNTPHLVSPTVGTRTKATTVTIKATLTDSDAGDTIKLRVIYSKKPDFSNALRAESSYVTTGKTASVKLTLDPNNHYYAHLYAIDNHGNVSLGYASANWYTNYAPEMPVLHTPVNGAQTTGLGSTVFTWTHVDADAQSQEAAQLRFRRDESGADWNTYTINSNLGTYTVNPGVFRSNTFYIWQVRTEDPNKLYGPWSDIFRFYVGGTHTPPRLVSPIKETGVDVGVPVELKWKFVDPDQGDSQYKADVRWRLKGQSDLDWITRLGDTTTPGGSAHWTFPIGTFSPGFSSPYEWQIRTYDTLGDHITPSEWSGSGYFYAVGSIGIDAGLAVPVSNAYAGALGCGNNTAYLAVKGGRRLLGQLTPLSTITWGRTRDDVSTCKVRVNITTSPECCALMTVMRCWQHEIVVFRDAGDGQRRVWEGPVTLIEYGDGYVDITAQDVGVWLQRRIMRQGYNDSYPNNISVVDRAARIIINALAVDDPNVLRYLTLYKFDDDAVSSRVRPDYSITSWEEVDDLAAKGGLDYTTVGRRILLWDTHRSIGKLPELRSAHFDTPPVVTEYGMNLAGRFAVTNGNGVYGVATYTDAVNKYGVVEMLASAYGDSAAASDATLTRDAKAKLVETYQKQAQRNIADRYPSPLVVRVPDNSTLRAETPVSIEHLVPGVWVPLRATHVCREFAQWQKLDSMTVTQSADQGEKVAIVLSPAPNGGQDPDADAAAVATADAGGGG